MTLANKECELKTTLNIILQGGRQNNKLFILQFVPYTTLQH